MAVFLLLYTLLLVDGVWLVWLREPMDEDEETCGAAEEEEGAAGLERREEAWLRSPVRLVEMK